MEPLSNERLTIPIDEVVWREVGDDLIILELGTSTYLMVNSTGKLIWEALVGSATKDELVAMLVKEFGVSTEQAESDVQSFLTTLTDRGLLRT